MKAELRNALGGLLDISPGADRVLYAEVGDEFIPVATVCRYPGCPVSVYEDSIKLMECGQDKD